MFISFIYTKCALKKFGEFIPAKIINIILAISTTGVVLRNEN